MLESTLHNQLKNFYAETPEMLEVWVDGYLVDVLRADSIVEIQTKNFHQIRPKLTSLLENHRILLVYPVAAEKWIVRQDGEHVSRRRSPRRGSLEDVFNELIRIPALIENPNLTLEIIFLKVEELRINDGKGSWRRKGWSIADRKIIEFGKQVRFKSPEDFRSLIPEDLSTPFTVQDLARQKGIPVNLARKMVYCLFRMGELELNGKRKRAPLYDLPKSRP